MKLTVILPAAGKGQRLNLPFSKEIFHIDDNKALIDFSFEHFLKCTRTQVHFIICLLYTSPSPRDRTRSRMPSSA